MNMNVLNIDSIDVEAGMRENFEKIETKNNSESGCDRFLNRKYKCVIIYVMFIVFIAETLISVVFPLRLNEIFEKVFSWIKTPHMKVLH